MNKSVYGGLIIMIQYKDKFYYTNDISIIRTRYLDVVNLLKQSYWADTRDEETIRLSIEHSLCFGILDIKKDIIIAFARIITDYATMYYATDVIVDERYRNQGLGKKFIEYILNDVRLKGYGLLTTKDAQDFYSKYGFKICQETCMCKLGYAEVI